MRAVRTAETSSRKTSPLNSPMTGAKRHAARMGELIDYVSSTVLQTSPPPRPIAALGVRTTGSTSTGPYWHQAPAAPGLDQALAAVPPSQHRRH